MSWGLSFEFPDGQAAAFENYYRIKQEFLPEKDILALFRIL